jgi:hypothetical protein
MRIPPRRIVWHSTSPSSTALARETETGPSVEMPLALRGRREQLDAARDFDDTLLALALRHAGCRDANSGFRGGGEDRYAAKGGDAAAVDRERDRHLAFYTLSQNPRYG